MKQAESDYPGRSARRWRACIASLLVLAASASAARAQEALTLAEGVHVFVGDTGEPSPANRGRIGNVGFVVGDRGTVMINAGASYRHGRALLAAAERIGGKPVVLVVSTQPVQEFVMGAAAFADQGIPVLAHRASAALIASRCEDCLHRLRQVLGEDEMAGSRVHPPERQIEASTTLEAGGRRLALIHPGWGSSPGDLVVHDARSGVVFAGALVSVDRVPELRDSDPQGWLAALDGLQALTRADAGSANTAGLPAAASPPAAADARIVPGYGRRYPPLRSTPCATTSSTPKPGCAACSMPARRCRRWCRRRSCCATRAGRFTSRCMAATSSSATSPSRAPHSPSEARRASARRLDRSRASIAIPNPPASGFRHFSISALSASSPPLYTPVTAVIAAWSFNSGGGSLFGKPR